MDALENYFFFLNPTKQGQEGSKELKNTHSERQIGLRFPSHSSPVPWQLLFPIVKCRGWELDGCVILPKLCCRLDAEGEVTMRLPTAKLCWWLLFSHVGEPTVTLLHEVELGGLVIPHQCQSSNAKYKYKWNIKSHLLWMFVKYCQAYTIWRT